MRTEVRRKLRGEVSAELGSHCREATHLCNRATANPGDDVAADSDTPFCSTWREVGHQTAPSKRQPHFGGALHTKDSPSSSPPTSPPPQHFPHPLTFRNKMSTMKAKAMRKLVHRLYLR